MPNDALAKIRRQAVKIRNKNPGMKYQTALKKAGREYREGKISGVKRKGGKRKGRGAVGTKPKYKVVHEVRRISGVSYKGGSVSLSGVADIEKAKKDLLYKLGEQAGWLEVAISQEKTVTGRKKLNKKLREIKAEMRRIS
jgi:hypothetical protein